MADDGKKNVPKIAITTYESNEEDAEVSNLLTTINEKNNIKSHKQRLVSPNSIKNKSRIILKSPISKNLRKSLSPGLLDNMSSHTDVEVMSDSDDEKDYVRTGNLTPGPIDYFILTDVEDLSEDEDVQRNNKTREDLTDSEHFTDNQGVYFNETEQAEPPIIDSSFYFSQPHRAILFHSKDGTVSEMSTTEEPNNPIRLKTLKEEMKGFESEEELITTEEYGETESYIKNNNTYFHDIDVGVEESVETVKHERCKQKYKNRTFPKKSGMPETESEWGKKRFRNKNRSCSEIEKSFEKVTEDRKKNALSKCTFEQTFSKETVPLQNQLLGTSKTKHQSNNNTFVIHDNRNGFSISIDFNFEGHNSVLLNVGRDNGSLSMKWLNNGITEGRGTYNSKNTNILELLEPCYFTQSNLYDPKRLFGMDLFTYGVIKTFQNRYCTHISVNTITQPVYYNIVQLYINRPFQVQMALVKKPLVKLTSLKDKFKSVEGLHPSSVTRLPAFKIFNQKNTEKYGYRKKIIFKYEKPVSDVIHIFESLCGKPNIRQKFSFKTLSNLEPNLEELNLKHRIVCTQNKKSIGN